MIILYLFTVSSFLWRHFVFCFLIQWRPNSLSNDFVSVSFFCLVIKQKP